MPAVPVGPVRGPAPDGSMGTAGSRSGAELVRVATLDGDVVQPKLAAAAVELAAQVG